MSSNQVLLVEGTDDQHVVWNLLKHHDFPEVFEVDQKGGIDRLMSTFPVQIKTSNMRSLGIVVDADLNLPARWASLRAKVESLGYADCPDVPPVEGLILNHPELPRFGAWLMPDNMLPGMLEDFVAYLVPDGDLLWTHSSDVIAGIPEGLREFSENHLCKVKIHTWLAWKADPGTPLGLAISKKYLRADAPAVTSFLDWLRRLFDIE